jgi:hypothetical protein
MALRLTTDPRGLVSTSHLADWNTANCKQMDGPKSDHSSQALPALVEIRSQVVMYNLKVIAASLSVFFNLMWDSTVGIGGRRLLKANHRNEVP